MIEKFVETYNTYFVPVDAKSFILGALAMLFIYNIIGKTKK